MKKTIAILLALVLALGVMFVGCGNSSKGDEGKTLTFGVQMYADGLINIPNQTNCAWNCMRFGISESLFKFNDDMETVPWLAESYEYSEDHLTWTIKLRDGIKFSNGTDVTATKVKESLDWIRAEGPNGSTGPETFLEFEAEVTADDATNTIVIQTKTPYVNLAGNLADPAMAIIDVAGTTDFDNGIIGTGPYMVKDFTDQVGYTMAKNPYYWDGEVPFDTVNILFMGDASAKANALLAGQIDIAENIMSVSDLATLQADENFTVDITAGVRVGFSWMNMAEGRPLSNKTLRQAVLMAIPADTICHSNVIGDLYSPGFSVLPSGMDYGYDQLTNPYPYDPDAAMALLDDAGIVDTNGNGIRELDGEDIYLTYVYYENRLLNDFSEAHAQYLSTIGIGTKMENGSSDDQWNKLVAGEYDLNNNNWNHLIAGAPVKYMANWYSPSENTDYCGYVNPEYDRLYAQLEVELDYDARRELLRQLQQILIDDAAVLVDGYYNSCIVYNNSTVGYAHIRPMDYYWLSTEIVPAS